ncbi:hypothetical protein [Actinocatenispora sera]|uniref:Uncharacterized protein n=1 Tax=Actinocatenispora sera TaxID=390989 RepID=A0A810LA36_9ACTN|nr:hypothetical protein [Actinocatenispora sera]BCJ32424.1 hypothetical protein Asera_65320 [Actinocatenispora sera]
MTDKVHADCTEIIKYAGQLVKISVEPTGKETKPAQVAPMMATLSGTQALNQMSDLSYNSFTRSVTGDTAGQFQEGLKVAGYLAQNVAAFQQFIPDVTNGIQCCAMQAQGVGQILMFTDGGSAGKISAEDVTAALAYASGNPGAERPDGIPKDMFSQGTVADNQSKATSNLPDAITDPDDPHATTFHQPGGYLTTTTYADGSYRVVESYTTIGANGMSVVRSKTTFYDKGGSEIKGSGESESTEYGNGYRTVTQHHGDTTVENVIHDDGSVDLKTTTKDAEGHEKVTVAHSDVPEEDKNAQDTGPMEGWENQADRIDGSQAPFNKTYSGY